MELYYDSIKANQEFKESQNNSIQELPAYGFWRDNDVYEEVEEISPQQTWIQTFQPNNDEQDLQDELTRNIQQRQNPGFQQESQYVPSRRSRRVQGLPPLAISNVNDPPLRTQNRQQPRQQTSTNITGTSQQSQEQPQAQTQEQQLVPMISPSEVQMSSPSVQLQSTIMDIIQKNHMSDDILNFLKSNLQINLNLPQQVKLIGMDMQEEAKEIKTSQKQFQDQVVNSSQQLMQHLQSWSTTIESEITDSKGLNDTVRGHTSDIDTIKKIIQQIDDLFQKQSKQISEDTNRIDWIITNFTELANKINGSYKSQSETNTGLNIAIQTLYGIVNQYSQQISTLQQNTISEQEFTQEVDNILARQTRIEDKVVQIEMVQQQQTTLTKQSQNDINQLISMKGDQNPQETQVLTKLYNHVAQLTDQCNQMITQLDQANTEIDNQKITYNTMLDIQQARTNAQSSFEHQILDLKTSYESQLNSFKQDILTSINAQGLQQKPTFIINPKQEVKDSNPTPQWRMPTLQTNPLSNTSNVQNNEYVRNIPYQYNKDAAQQQSQQSTIYQDQTRPGIYQVPAGTDLYSNQRSQYNNTFNKYYSEFKFPEKFEYGKNPVKFIRRFEDKAQKASLTDEQMIREIQYCLEYEQDSWYQEQLELVGFSSWEDFRNKFIEEFKEEAEMALMQLSSMKQLPGQSIGDFLESLRKVAEPAVISDTRLRTYFLNGVNIPELRMECQKLLGLDKNKLQGKSTTTLKNMLSKICQNTNISEVYRSRAISSTPVRTQPLNRQTSNRYYYQQPQQQQQQTQQQQPQSPVTRPTQQQNRPNENNRRQDNRPRQGFQQRRQFPNQNNRKVQWQDQRRQTNQFGESNEPIQSNVPITEIHQVSQPDDFENFDSYGNFHDESIIEEPEDSQPNEVQLQEQTQFSQEENNTLQSNERQGDYFTGILQSTPVNAGIACKQAGEIQDVQTSSAQASAQAGESNLELLNAQQGQQVKSQTSFPTQLQDFLQNKSYSYDKQRTIKQIPITEEQLLRESPVQFIKAFKFLLRIIKDESNYLRDKDILDQFQRLENLIEQKHKSLLTSTIVEKGAKVHNTTECDAFSANIITFRHMLQNFTCASKMYYIPINFNGHTVNALLDTGSVITVVTQSFLDKIRYDIKTQMNQRKMITANGTSEIVPEIPNAYIGMERDFTLNGSVVVSKAKDYELLIGLDILTAINGFVNPYSMQFHYFIAEIQQHRRIQAMKLDTFYYRREYDK